MIKRDRISRRVGASGRGAVWPRDCQGASTGRCTRGLAPRIDTVSYGAENSLRRKPSSVVLLLVTVRPGGPFTATGPSLTMYVYSYGAAPRFTAVFSSVPQTGSPTVTPSPSPSPLPLTSSPAPQQAFDLSTACPGPAHVDVSEFTSVTWTRLPRLSYVDCSIVLESAYATALQLQVGPICASTVGCTDTLQVFDGSYDGYPPLLVISGSVNNGTSHTYVLDSTGPCAGGPHVGAIAPQALAPLFCCVPGLSLREAR